MGLICPLFLPMGLRIRVWAWIVWACDINNYRIFTCYALYDEERMHSYCTNFTDINTRIKK